jgi:uncharacterized membrane protein
MKRSRSPGLTARRRFISGILVVVPLGVTYLVLKFLFTTVDGVLAGVVQAVFGREIPGVGILVTILLIMVTGWIATGVAGGRLIRIWEGWLIRIPLIRIVYGAAKQFLESLANRDDSSFQQVGLIEYPRLGIYSFCFLSNRLTVAVKGESEERITAFVPSTPTPFTGMVVMVKPAEVIPLTIKVEDAIKLLVSGGIVVPSQLTAAAQETNS